MEEDKSKSQLKREAEALQKLGVALTKLSAQQLAKIPMPNELHDAVLQAKTIKSHSAMRRHAQYIGRIMRDIDDISPIQTAYDNLQQGLSSDRAQFHLIEKWRERLLNGGNDALTEFLDEYQCDDVQHLRHLIKQAIRERDQNKNLGASKTLFRYISRMIS